MLSVRHLSVTHLRDLKELIHDLSFTVSGTDRLAVIGEEGNGKSTLLKLIYDAQSVQSYCSHTGEIACPGEAPGYLSQEIPPESRDLPVYAWCAEHPAFLDISPKELNRLCAQLQLPPDICYADQPVASLSGGEKVKLRLLLALCGHPTLLLLDEPSNDLDLPTLRFLEGFILSCGLPVVFISHDETLLSRTATRVLHLEMAYHKKEPRWTLANMPYDQYMAQRAHAIQRQEAQAQMERREERAQQERFQRIQQAVEHAQNAVSRQDPGTGRLLKKKPSNPWSIALSGSAGSRPGGPISSTPWTRLSAAIMPCPRASAPWNSTGMNCGREIGRWRRASISPCSARKRSCWWGRTAAAKPRCCAGSRRS